MTTLRNVLVAVSIALMATGAVGATSAFAVSDTTQDDEETTVEQPCISNVDGKPGTTDGTGSANGGNAGTIDLGGKAISGCASANGGNGGRAVNGGSANGGKGGTIKF